ncbi:MAG: ATP-binding cassette domain-containing protein [Trueperaceae bacterium]|nr:ATP-binding cassette domain-containing protein [Trueperaceae bacterium]
MSKRFGGVEALKPLDLEVRRGEVLAIVGDNGAGKSTLVKVLTGVHPADAGTIEIDGRPVKVDHPDVAKAQGIETIYQDLALVPTFDLGANFFLGREPMKRWLGILPVLDVDRMRREARQVVEERVGLEIRNPYNPAAVMSGGQRQAVAIGRALYAEAALVIMDEPTAALGVEEQEKVLAIIDRLKGQGVTVLVISHNLEHVFRVADRIAIMHNGHLLAVRDAATSTRAEIVGLIMGSDLRAAT